MSNVFERVQKRFAEYLTGPRPSHNGTINVADLLVKEKEQAAKDAYLAGYHDGQTDLRNEANGIIRSSKNAEPDMVAKERRPFEESSTQNEAQPRRKLFP